eukprot:scaffold346_cov116-Cylindrotheca_fusiformis.AAC.21
MAGTKRGQGRIRQQFPSNNGDKKLQSQFTMCLATVKRYCVALYFFLYYENRTVEDVHKPSRI